MSLMSRMHFLHKKLDKDLHIEATTRYGNNLDAHTIYKLKKVLYEFEQSPRVQFGKFMRVINVMRYMMQTHPAV